MSGNKECSHKNCSAKCSIVDVKALDKAKKAKKKIIEGNKIVKK